MRPNLRAVLITAFAFAFGPIHALVDDDQILDPFIIGTDPSSGIPITFITGDWVTFLEADSSPNAYLGTSTQNYRGRKTPFQTPILQRVTSTGDFTQFQLLVGNDDTFEIRDASSLLFYTRLECSATNTPAWTCFGANSGLIPLESIIYGNYKLEQVEDSRFKLFDNYSGCCIGPASNYDDNSYGLACGSSPCQLFEISIVNRSDLQAQSDMEDIEFFTPTQVGNNLTITNATAAQITLNNNSTLKARLQEQISFEITDTVSWEHGDSTTIGVTASVKFSVGVPFVTSITVGVEYSKTDTDITESTTSKTTTISGTVTATVPANSSAEIIVAAFTAHDPIPWQAVVTRTLLDKQNLPLRDTDGNTVPGGKFRVHGIANVDNYYNYVANIINIMPLQG